MKAYYSEDWSAEQHEAAAAALGMNVRRTLGTLAELCEHEQEHHSLKSICDGLASEAQWTAISAARHAHAAMRAQDAIGAALKARQ